jgi:hypothetical protein
MTNSVLFALKKKRKGITGHSQEGKNSKKYMKKVRRQVK